jgi:hypothetical protein
MRHFFQPPTGVEGAAAPSGKRSAADGWLRAVSHTASAVANVQPSVYTGVGMQLRVREIVREQDLRCKLDAQTNSIAAGGAVSRSNAIPVFAHADETDILAWEGMTVRKAMLAGSTAGFIEHVATFPVDTIKTRMQVRLLVPLSRCLVHLGNR